MAKDKQPGNGPAVIPAAPTPERRTYTTLPLAQLVPSVTRVAYRKRSPAGATLMSEWAAIVGPRLAAETEPRRLSGTQLTIACSGPMALELQHVASTLIERINTHAGSRIVERLRFVQDFSMRPVPVRRRHVDPEPVEGMEAGALNDALAGLRAAMKGRG